MPHLWAAASFACHSASLKACTAWRSCDLSYVRASVAYHAQRDAHAATSGSRCLSFLQARKGKVESRAKPVREEIMRQPVQDSASFREPPENAAGVGCAVRWQRMPRAFAQEETLKAWKFCNICPG